MCSLDELACPDQVGLDGLARAIAAVQVRVDRQVAEGEQHGVVAGPCCVFACQGSGQGVGVGMAVDDEDAGHG